jgi:small-conductance mechanosensitive channel
MKAFFDYILFGYFEQNFTVTNLMLVCLVITSIFFFRKYISKRLERLLLKRDWKLGNGKEKIVHILLSQSILIIGTLLLVSSLGYGNNDFSLNSILDIHLLEIGDFKLSLGQLIAVIVLIFLSKVFLNLSKVIIFKATKGKEWIDEGRQFTIVQLTKYFVYIIFAMLVVKSLGFGLNSLFWASSGLLLGLGMGLKDMFTDVVSGFILLFDGSVKVGDIVEMGDVIARVEKINIRTSHVKSMDGKIIVLPNSKLTEDNVINWTISDKVTRFHITVSVAYGSDTEKVRELLYQCALNHKLVNKHREIIIMFNDFGDSGLEFELYFWAARTWEIMVIKSDLRFAIDKSFRENGITIPFPQRDLHIVSDSRNKETTSL